MERSLKERLVGAAVLVILAVIFIPMLFDDTQETEPVITATNIPPKPDDMSSPPEGDFSSRIIPLEQGEANTVIPKPEEKTADKPIAENKPATDITAATEEQVPSKTAVIDEEPPTNVGLSAWVVQLGSFTSEENAQVLNQKLRKAGYSAFVEPLKQKTNVVYRVRVGPELKRSDAESIRDELKKTMKLDGIVAQYP